MSSSLVARHVSIVIVSLGALLGTVHCSSSASDGSGSACGQLCDCVASKGGNRSDCMSQCNDVTSKTTSASERVSECESRLDANGVGSCKSTCQAFSSSSSSGSGARSALCAKCSSCVGTSGFDEGFCNEYKSGGEFDESACNASSDSSQLANPSVSASTVNGWSCSDFDKAE